MSSTQPTASHFISGRYVEDKSGSRFDVIYPASGAVIAQIHAGTDQIIEQALGAAQAAQQDWAARSGTERGRVLRRAADLIRARNRELSVLETHDTGKPLSETLYADATSGADALEYFGGLAGNVTGEHIQLGEDWVYTRREALGICLGIGAWNYPTQIACWKAAPALACGNAMIFKPSETTPLCALKIAEILSEAGLPDGVVNILSGYGDPVGMTLSESNNIDMITFTGSTAVGKHIMRAAATNLKKVELELGGKNPQIIFPDANIDELIDPVVFGIYFNMGECCNSGSRIIIHKDIVDEFIEKLVAHAKKVKVGDPLDPTVKMGAIINDMQYDKIIGYIKSGIKQGATLQLGGTSSKTEKGAFIDPTIFSDVTPEMAIACEEIFGPILSILTFDTADEALEIANNTEFGLSASVWTKDIDTAMIMTRNIEAGTVWVNNWMSGYPEIPFGGMKQSGIGRELGPRAIDEFMETKSVLIKTGKSSNWV